MHLQGVRVVDLTRVLSGLFCTLTMWGTEMTATFTRQAGQAALCIAVDDDAAECVGIHAATQGTRLEALEPLRQGGLPHCEALGQDIAQGVGLRHDHGSS
jgi:putative transposase